MNQNYQDQLRSSRSINDELRLLSRTINDYKNKNDNKTNKHISTLLEGKSKTQVKNNSRKTKKNNSNQQSIMNQNYQDQLRSLSRSINDELRLLSRTINDDKNKNDNKTNKHISTLLEGKSKTQVKNNSRNYCRWTKEDDAIIIKNKK
jgi:ribosomal protein L18E